MRNDDEIIILQAKVLGEKWPVHFLKLPMCYLICSGVKLSMCVMPEIFFLLDFTISGVDLLGIVKY